MWEISPMMLLNKNYSLSSALSAKSNPFKSPWIKSPKKIEDLHSSSLIKSKKHCQPSIITTKLNSWTELSKWESQNHWISNPIITYLSGIMTTGSPKCKRKKYKTKSLLFNKKRKTDSLVFQFGKICKRRSKKNRLFIIKKTIDFKFCNLFFTYLLFY